ncbi:isochorismate synthase [Polaribacter sp. KT25b]|uniref:chorismate-binding protein n=1 Tax=Polaribacter sp. KT25b TaxID=1855336 RepID=UPI0008793221|nr:chorismate-binding protein [Polaribacter sp. KT25b]SDR82930.1 isochorismate synthase [Polaribacter sp. KT25b]
MKIFNNITAFYKEAKPFVVYRKPNSFTISGFFMRDETLFFTDNFAESGFVFAPFDSEQKAILFPFKKSEFITEKLSLDTFITDEKTFSADEASKENHIKLVEKTIKEIKKNDFKKVVISRTEEVEISDFNLLEIYQKLLQNYSNAFAYVWFHPKVGLWLGATPETLLNIENSVFTTMSLAGTQVYENTENVVWKNKELEEQQLVTDFIKNQLTDISSNLKIDKTETVKAGSLLHLKTKVTGVLNEKSNLKTLVRALHPTPAVCGLPREKAKKFILENEYYKRSFYTGFLGELNIENSTVNIQNSSLFVNLRCMNINKNKASLFIGGGITKDSNATKEWEETVSKSNVMKRVL